MMTVIVILLILSDKIPTINAKNVAIQNIIKV
jgi:hypothetical protein